MVSNTSPLIALAKLGELRIMMDDRKAFNEAKEHHVVVVSTRTILGMAKEKGIIADDHELERILRDKQFFLPNY